MSGCRRTRHTRPMADLAVHRVDFGYFVRPAEETGTGTARVEPCLGYLVSHPAGLLLVDTGMGRHPEVDAHYRPRRRNLDAALAGAGERVDGIRFLVNCHLHFDHCGGNPALPGRPIFTQRAELETALHTPDYTLPGLVDAPGLRYEQLDGEAEILPGWIDRIQRLDPARVVFAHDNAVWEPAAREAGEPDVPSASV